MKSESVKIKSTVYDLLVNDKRTRIDDIYLYKKVISILVPSLLSKSFDDVLSNHMTNGFINIDTIRRIRAKIQESHPELVDEEADNARRKRQFLFLRELQAVN